MQIDQVGVNEGDIWETELWDTIMLKWDDMGLDGYKTPRIIEVEALYNHMCRKFAETLTNSQQQAFNALLTIDRHLKDIQEDLGIAMGAKVIPQVQDVSGCPIESLKLSELTYTSVSELKPFWLQELNKYFDEVNHNLRQN